MKTLKPLIAALLMLFVYIGQAQNACFGTFTFQAEGAIAPNIGFRSSYLLNANWTVDSATWHFGDGSFLTTNSPYPLHDYSATTDTSVDVCLVVYARDTVNSIVCVDTVCKSVELCAPQLYNSVYYNVNGFSVSFTSQMFVFGGGTYPIKQTINYGDGSAVDTFIFSSAGNTNYTHTYAAAGTYLVNVSSYSPSNCVKDTTLIISIANNCNVNASYTYTLSNDTALLTNTSSPLGAIASYEVQAKYASSGSIYSTASGSFGTLNKVKLPQDTLMNVCLIAHDTSGTCKDTFCTSIGIWQPCAVVSSFTFTQTGSAVLVYNASTGNYPPLTYQWQAPGAWPSSSTATDTAFYFSQPGIHQICLVATNAIGCKDTFCTTINNIPTDTLCGMVFIDANSNGIYDGGEQVRPNSTVHVDGHVFITDGTGFYKAPVVSGAHLIELQAPPGWAQTYPDTPLVYNITTTNGEYLCGLDFGMRDDTLTLSGITYYDNNGNGLYDAGDQPRPNVPVTVNGLNGPVTVYSNSQGYYSVMVYSGTYTVSSTIASAYSSTQPQGSNQYSITAYLSSITGINFGLRSNAITITGKVFLDANNNGVYDAGELGVQGHRVRVGFNYVYTNANGDWIITCPAGTYSLQYTIGAYHTATSPTTITLLADSAGTTYANNNFGITLPAGTGDICVNIDRLTNVIPALNPCRYVLSIKNFGTTPVSGTLVMHYDSILHYLYSNIMGFPFAVDSVNRTISWNVNLGLGSSNNFYPFFNVATNAVLGTNVINSIMFYPSGGFVNVNLPCNSDTLYQQVVTGYDPNDKYVSPIGEGSNHAIANVGQKLDYTIMFQNTGNAPAVNVILLDTVESNLDISTLTTRSASHDYTLEVRDRELQFTFTNIMLPDSNTSADSSIGFVSFSMNVLANLPVGTEVQNTAGIYFDYNDVVLTGKAFNTIETPTSIRELQQGRQITLQPNPFSSYTTLVIADGDDKAAYTLRVYDMFGRLVQQQTSYGNVIRIDRNGMPEGLYLYEVEQNRTLIGKGKMIAE